MVTFFRGGMITGFNDSFIIVIPVFKSIIGKSKELYCYNIWQ
jgi:hypothetical protein